MGVRGEGGSGPDKVPSLHESIQLQKVQTLTHLGYTFVPACKGQNKQTITNTCCTRHKSSCPGHCSYCMWPRSQVRANSYSLFESGLTSEQGCPTKMGEGGEPWEQGRLSVWLGTSQLETAGWV